MNGLPIVESLASQGGGEIDGCATAGCGRTCCDFSSGNYIVLYPGELNAAAERGVAVHHLELRPSAEGGHRAICHADDTATCDGGYKPLDCASYPFFPTIDGNDEVDVARFGRKCPLEETSIGRHREWVKSSWSELASTRGAVRAWLRRVTLVGYRQARRAVVAGPSVSR